MKHGQGWNYRIIGNKYRDTIFISTIVLVSNFSYIIYNVQRLEKTIFKKKDDIDIYDCFNRDVFQLHDMVHYPYILAITSWSCLLVEACILRCLCNSYWQYVLSSTQILRNVSYNCFVNKPNKTPIICSLALVARQCSYYLLVWFILHSKIQDIIIQNG